MPAVLRAHFAALGSLFAVSIPHAQPATLPPIFEARPATHDRRAMAGPAARAPISERARSLMIVAADRVLAEAKVFDAPVPLPLSSTAAEQGKDEPTIMERYVVQSRPLRLIERRLPDPPLLDFLKTGTFYRGPDARGLTRIGLRMLILQEPGLGWGKEFTRGQIEFIFRW